MIEGIWKLQLESDVAILMLRDGKWFQMRFGRWVPTEVSLEWVKHFKHSTGRMFEEVTFP